MKIKSFEEACIRLNIDHTHPTFSEGTRDEIAYKKLKVILRALNDGWIADYNTSTQGKCYPWFRPEENVGLKFRVACGPSTAIAVSGEFLCSKSKEVAVYAATHFEHLYKEFLTRDPVELDSFESACKRLNYNPGYMLVGVSEIQSRYQKQITAMCKLAVITEALNKTWEPNWGTSDVKYYPVFDTQQGLGTVAFKLMGIRSATQKPSMDGTRFYFRSEALAKYAGENHIDLFQDLFMYEHSHDRKRNVSTLYCH